MREMDTSEHHHHYPVVVHHHHHHYQARSDDQGGGRLIRRAPFPSAPSPKMETVDNHKPRSFDLTPLPLRRQAEHGPQSFDLIPLPHRGNAAPPASAMQEKVETVDDHGPQSFDLTPLPHRGHAEHAPQSFDLLPLPNRGNLNKTFLQEFEDDVPPMTQISAQGSPGSHGLRHPG